MTSAEKLEKCFHNEPVKDRREIPVMLHTITYAATCAGMKQKDIFYDNQEYQRALKMTYDKVGYPDCSYNIGPGDAAFGETLPVRRPGIELGDNELYQFIESINMDLEDFKILTRDGWNSWYNSYICRIQTPPFKNHIQLMMRWMKFGKNVKSNIKFLRKLGIEPMIGSGMYPAFDIFSLIRSFGEFIMDLYDEESLIKAAMDKCTPDIIESAIKTAKMMPVNRIEIFAMRSSASVISPTIFEEFVYPYLKQIVEALYKAGYLAVIHADGNWLPMLEYFMELPKNSIHFEFDGLTDMRKAYEIIGGWHSMRGGRSCYNAVIFRT